MIADTKRKNKKKGETKKRGQQGGENRSLPLRSTWKKKGDLAVFGPPLPDSKEER